MSVAVRATIYCGSACRSGAGWWAANYRGWGCWSKEGLVPRAPSSPFCTTRKLRPFSIGSILSVPHFSGSKAATCWATTALPLRRDWTPWLISPSGLTPSRLPSHHHRPIRPKAHRWSLTPPQVSLAWLSSAIPSLRWGYSQLQKNYQRLLSNAPHWLPPTLPSLFVAWCIETPSRNAHNTRHTGRDCKRVLLKAGKRSGKWMWAFPSGRECTPGGTGQAYRGREAVRREKIARKYEIPSDCPPWNPGIPTARTVLTTLYNNLCQRSIQTTIEKKIENEQKTASSFIKE